MELIVFINDSPMQTTVFLPPCYGIGKCWLGARIAMPAIIMNLDSETTIWINWTCHIEISFTSTLYY